jgi:hypothetical protein
MNRAMYALCGIVILVGFLSAIGSKAVACTTAIPSVARALQEADIVAVMVVDSIQSDYVVLIPDVVLKGNTVRLLRLRRYDPDYGVCAISRQPYSVGDRLIVMLSETGERSDELPAYAPMRMNLPNGHKEAEQTMLAYLSYVIESGIAPIEIRVHGKGQYVVGEEIALSVSVTNRLKVPIVTAMDSSILDSSIRTDLLLVRFVVNGLGFESSPSHTGLHVVPPETTEEMTIVLQDFFGEMRAGNLWFVSFVQFPVNPFGSVFAERPREGARHQFSISDETNVATQSWGKAKQDFSP